MPTILNATGAWQPARTHAGWLRGAEERSIHSMTSNEGEFARAQRVLVGGVNSAVRAFRAVGGIPRFIARAEGAYMWDVQGRRYVDYLGSWGPMIVGHAHPQVIERVREAAGRSLSYGAPNVYETELAERICALFGHVERVRFTSSGTESAMSAIRLARGFTGRDKIVKFEGCYHGTADSLLVKAGSGMLAFGGHVTSDGIGHGATGGGHPGNASDRAVLVPVAVDHLR